MIDRIKMATDCWEWQGSKTTAGYGTLYHKGKRVYAHRHYYELHKGPIPDGLHIDHLCRNRGCYNPAHLEAVTPGVNAHRSSKTVVSAETVEAIRCDALTMSIRNVAKKHRMPIRYVNSVARGERRMDAGGPVQNTLPNFRGAITKERQSEIQRLRANGVPLKDVAAQFGISKSYCSQIATGDFNARH